jgi:hypothetical protein
MEELPSVRGEGYWLFVVRCDCGMAVGFDTRIVPEASGESLWVQCPNPECKVLITMGVR